MALFDSGEFLLHIKSRFDAIKKLFFRRLQADQTVLNQLKKRPEFINPAMILQGFYFSFDKLISRLENHGISHIGHLKRILEQKKTLLQSLKPEKQLSVKKSQMDQFKQSFLHLRQNFIKDKQYSLKNLKLGLKQAMQLHIKDTQAKLKQTAQLLESIHPDNVLKKGYAILTSIDGQTPYTSVYDIQENQDAYLKLKDGSVVIKIKEKSLI
jgi:exonuclease VII large subunit